LVVGDDERRYLLTPMFTTVKIEGTGDTVVASAKMKYPDGSDWYVISLATIRGGKIVKLVQYFAPVYEAPEWRSQWVERIEG
ncbi:MAG TPA: hypothetical protein VE131_16285, partial [Terriglobales bacterium]|nr:hypothetical protein [Terriglobales bacterium]